MDWRKFFDFESDDKDKKQGDKFNFKKFDDEEDEDDWFDLETFFNEFHDSRFQFHGFPKSTMRQFKEILEQLPKDIEDEDVATKERKLQQFYDNYSDFKQKTDKDLDGKIYANQLDSILQKIHPEIMQKGAKDVQIKAQQPIRKLTDEEKIMDIIHGTYKEEVKAIVPKQRKRQYVHKAPFSPHHFNALPPFNEFHPPPTSSPTTKSWGRTFISIRNPDGSYETRKIERTPDGNTRTTITRKDSDGNSSTQSFVGDEPREKLSVEQPNTTRSEADHNERNLVNYNGYKIPCLW